MSPVMETVQLILTMISLGIGCVVLLLILREFHFKNQNTPKPPKTILAQTYTTIILLLTSMIISAVHIAGNKSFLNDIISNLAIIISWSMAQLLSFSIIMTRIHYISSSTKYALKERNYIVFTILFFICILLSIVWILRCILYYNQYKKDHMTQKGLHQFSVFFVITVEIIELIISVFFVLIFVSRLKMIAQTAETQLRVQKVMIKYWILSLIIIVFAQIIAFMLCLIFVTDYIGENEASKAITDVYGLLFPLNPIGICVCLLLMFEAFEGYYDKCGLCDTVSRRCFGIMTQDKALQQSLLAVHRATLIDNQLL